MFPYYIVWHYSRAFSDSVRIWKNFLLFIYNFFSIKTLFLTLFSSWRRMGDTYSKGMGMSEVLSTFVLNTIMRCVGAVVRLIFIFTGIIALIIGVILGLAFFAFWILLPAILVYLIPWGIVKVSS